MEVKVVTLKAAEECNIADAVKELYELSDNNSIHVLWKTNVFGSVEPTYEIKRLSDIIRMYHYCDSIAASNIACSIFTGAGALIEIK